MISVRLHLFRNPEIDYPGTDGDRPVEPVDIMDLLEPGHFDDHALLPRYGTSGKSGSGAPGDEGDFPRVKFFHDFHQFVPVSREHHPHRRGGIERQAVTTVGVEGDGIILDPILTQQADKLSTEFFCKCHAPPFPSERFWSFGIVLYLPIKKIELISNHHSEI